MHQPSRTTLYALIAAFIVLAVLGVLAGGFLSLLIYVVLLALLVYFIVIAVREFRQAKEQERSADG